MGGLDIEGENENRIEGEGEGNKSRKKLHPLRDAHSLSLCIDLPS